MVCHVIGLRERPYRSLQALTIPRHYPVPPHTVASLTTFRTLIAVQLVIFDAYLIQSLRQPLLFLSTIAVSRII